MSDDGDDPAGVALRALVEPRRRAILRLVAHDELSAGEIAATFDVTRPAVSQHLTVLKEAGLLSERREGTRRLYRARPEGLAELRAFVEDFWDHGLDRLKREAEAEERRRSHGGCRMNSRCWRVSPTTTAGRGRPEGPRCSGRSTRAAGAWSAATRSGCCRRRRRRR